MAQPPIPRDLRRQVSARAEGRCEYCRLSEDDSPYTHHIDHVIALKHGGPTATQNLALACIDCNRYKGSDVSGFDPETGALVPLFHPRQQRWDAHFLEEGPFILGQTETGRATVVLLRLNDPHRVELRQALAAVRADERSER